MVDVHALKEAGNAAFKAGRFDDAIEQYSQAVELARKNEHSDLHVFLSNRAQTQLEKKK